MEVLKELRKYDPDAKVLSSGDIRMKCPYRENHTDGSGRMSMFVKPDTNQYHCFSCSQKGKVVEMLTTKFGISLFKAIDLVNFGSLLEEEFETYEEVKLVSIKAKTFEPDRLLTFDKPPKYFLDRGFTKEILRQFKVGYFIEEGTQNMTIPMHQEGRLVGVKYRIEEPYHTFWYNEDFERRKFLYNEGEWAKAILVESETDTWRAVQNGTKNVVATLGTVMAKEQVIRLSKYEEVAIAYDNDTPGFLAREKAYHKLKNHTEVTFIPYQSEDPGCCTQEEWLDAYKNRTDYATYSLEMTLLLGEEYSKLQKEAKRQLGIR